MFKSKGKFIKSTKEGYTCYIVWSQSDKPVVFYNSVGTVTQTDFAHYFYTCPERSRRDAVGDRVKKLTRKGQQLEVTVYMDGGLFELSYVKVTGIRIDPNNDYNILHVLDGTSRISTVRVGNDANDPTPVIKYYLEDHTSATLSAGLGNSTVVLTTTGPLVNLDKFYPFGETSFGSFAKKRYGYNGKEKDEESGLYEYGQRYYAPWLCRFVSVDPIAEDFPYYTSYNYAGNKPESKVDLEGLQEKGAQPAPAGATMDGSSPEFKHFTNSILGSFNPDSISGYSIVHNIDSYGNETGNIEVLDLDGLIAGGADYPLGAPSDLVPSSAPSDDKMPQVNYDLDYITSLPDGGYSDPNYSTPPTDSFDWAEALSDAWNSPIARAIVPDKVGLSVSTSAIAGAGFGKDISLNWITRGNDASFLPYPTFSISAQVGAEIIGFAGIGVSSGYYLVSDLRKLDEGVAAKQLLGSSVLGSGVLADVVGVSIGGEIGLRKLPFSEPTTIDMTVAGGIGFGGGISGGLKYTFPIFPSQFK